MAKKKNIIELNKQAFKLCFTDPQKSFDLAQKAVIQAGLENDPEQYAQAKATMAYSEQSLGLLAESYDNAIIALKYFLETQNKEKISFLYNTLGFVFYYLGNNEKRLEVNLKSLELREETKETDLDSYLRSLNNTGDTYLELNKPKKALELLSGILPHLSFIQKNNPALQSIVFHNIGAAQLLLKRFEEAEKNIKKAFLSAEKNQLKSIQIVCLLTDAKIKIKTEKKELAKKQLIKALEFIKGEEVLNEECKIYELLHHLYADDKNWEKAYFFHEKHFKTKSKIEEKRNKKELKGISFRHQIRELQNEKKGLYDQVKIKTKEVFDISRFPAENPNCVMRINNKGKIVYANVPAKKNFLTLFGANLNEKIPKQMSALIKEADKTKERILNKIVRFDDRTFAVAVKKIERNQSKVFSFLGFDDELETNTDDYYNLYAHEITKYQHEVDKRELALKKTLEAIRIKDNKTRTILDYALDGIILVSEDWKFLEWNKQTKKILKISKVNQGEYSLFDFIANTKDQNKKDVIRICKKTQRDGNSLRKQIVGLDSKNEQKHLEVSVTFASTIDGVEGIVFIKDITSQKKSEEQSKYMFKQRQLDFEIEQTINKFVQIIFSKNTIEDVLWSLAKECIAKMGFVDCVIYLLDEERGELIQKAAHGAKNPLKLDILNPITIPLGEGIVGTVAKTGKSEIILDTTKDKRYILDDEKRKSEITVPIMLEEKAIGVIDSEHPEKNFFTEKHLRILTTVSSIVANRIDKLKERKFFGYILNNLPADIVVFNSKHEYVFINPSAIKEEKIRQHLMGKTDAYYCELKKISKEITKQRRVKFLEVLKTKQKDQWEEKTSHNEKKEVILRIMSPVLTENNKIDYVVCYGIDITSRVVAEEKREALQQQIIDINASLEKEVDQKTQENIKLSEKMVEQERLVLAGEIAGTVAHELNTPLGAIVAGSEGMRENMDLLFSNLLTKCSSKEIDFAFKINLDLGFSLFAGGRKAMKIKKEINKNLIVAYGVSENQSEEFSDLFFKSNIDLKNKENVQFILESKNPKRFLQLILSIGTIRTLLETTIESSKRSAAVIQNIKKSLTVTKNQEKTIIDLKKNILSVIKLFRHQIESIADLEIDLEDELYIEGIDFKLFQLWTNIIKNAIYAIKEKQGEKKIKIKAKKQGKMLVVSISNNGPQIPEKIKDKIFDKFYTTKDKKGSGLGLGIARGVIDTHQALVSVDSSLKETSFNFSFRRKTKEKL